ncbi:heavy metal translocating P-type ATPase [Hoeflea prorocentri]|uniref:Heavy metal translocating P-type ATPase n=1 Tax=Hoeflea prorocentri TaxID=1922333 RepID=A0A9X3UIQ6_9HYPH|nr:heavy metal translocating P-type ATPase [Hoeflea prorocentri]MCY6381341.1 heavy metal translocating P-type ATPase [Hoeflea prorocentri]MDA5399141.1 heavy metal translocating P-type ATPase [Hoeflea prorocentri]
MSCCAPGTESAVELEKALHAGPSSEELRLTSRSVGEGLRQSDLSVPGIHCGACIRTIENGLGTLDFVKSARVNMSTKRVSVVWSENAEKPDVIVEALHGLGYEAHLFDFSSENEDSTLPLMLRSLAVAGFAAANIMLLSVSVWSGAEAATRDLFHWISALIAAPALAYSGRVFFHSAYNALSHKRLNMDVPISLAVILAFAMSLYETANSGDHVYFDASVTLLFFLLIGRTLDHLMRERARSAVKGLAQLAPRGAMTLKADGSREFVAVDDITAGSMILLAAGDRIPVDARVVSGTSDLDCSLVNGESAPQTVSQGNIVRAGTLNLTGALQIEAMAPASQSFLAEMMELMERAEGGKARYRRIADRAAELYAPIVHLVALFTFIGWTIISGDWQQSLYTAIAVLIITCPCALALAVPVVQVVAAGRLFENGVMVKEGSAMERMAQADMVVFDKTGTLTLGQPRLLNGDEIDPAHLKLAAQMGVHSRHPLSRALARSAGRVEDDQAFNDIKETPGAGLEARRDGVTYRLGRADWALSGNVQGGGETNSDKGQAVLSADGRFLAAFVFEDRLRSDAAATVAALKATGPVEMISGDRAGVVRRLAEALGIDKFRAGALPKDKARYVSRLSDDGKKVLMVGDGLNDAPALVSAHVSMAPATAADVGRNAADFVFLHESLTAVTKAIEISKKSGQLIRQNLGLAVIYNMIAIPSAILGYASPLVAALAMSSSSLVVVANALRLRAGAKADAEKIKRDIAVARQGAAGLEPATVEQGR